MFLELKNCFTCRWQVYIVREDGNIDTRNLQKYVLGGGKYMYEGQQEMALGGSTNMHKGTAEICTVGRQKYVQEDDKQWMVKISTINLQKYARGRGKYMYDRVAKNGTRWWYKYAQRRNGRNMHERRQKYVWEDGKKSHKWMVKISTRNLQTYTRGVGQYTFEG